MTAMSAWEAASSRPAPCLTDNFKKEIFERPASDFAAGRFLFGNHRWRFAYMDAANPSPDDKNYQSHR
jgi:hypothetical protein